MSIENFIKDFANQFDETEASEFTPETKYRDLDEWSSLTALAVLNMISKKYDIVLKPDEMRCTTTIRELYDVVVSKK